MNSLTLEACSAAHPPCDPALLAPLPPWGTGRYCPCRRKAPVRMNEAPRPRLASLPLQSIHLLKGKNHVQVGNSEKYGGSTDPRGKYGERPCRSARRHVGRGDDE